MNEFRDKIPAAGGNVSYIYEDGRGISVQCSSSSPTAHALYQVALSIDGSRMLCTVPPGGLGQTVTMPQPSVLAFVQSDAHGLFGRKCPTCEKYFRSDHVVGETTCPYCYRHAPDLAFVSNDQKRYLAACYDAFAHAHMRKQTMFVSLGDITDENSAWHYSEEKQQLLFTCEAPNCHCRTDVLGDYGFCPRCGKSNAGERFLAAIQCEIDEVARVKTSIQDRIERQNVWERMTKDAVSRFEALARHLRKVLMLFPMTPKRHKLLGELSFQRIGPADALLREWFDISVFKWRGDDISSQRELGPGDQAFIAMMFQKRHILTHTGGIVDDEYIRLSGDSNVQIDERIRVSGKEIARFLSLIREMGSNLIDSVERGFVQE